MSKHDSDLVHHPVIQRAPAGATPPRAGFRINFLGVLQREVFSWRDIDASELGDGDPSAGTDLPDFNPTYFEFVEVLSALEQARDSFRMFELGAATGPWCMAAATVNRATRGLPVHFTAVEADPVRFAWMHANFWDNGFDPNDHALYHAAIQDEDGEAAFWFGMNPRASIGNSVIGTEGLGQPEGAVPYAVRAISLATLLERHGPADLIHMDAQGAEATVIPASIDRMNDQVGRLALATHNTDVHHRLADLLARNGWTQTWCFEPLRENETPYGAMRFNDGFQGWINPRRGGG